MVLADFLTETRRRWLQAFKLFKRNKNRKNPRNRVSPLVRTPSCGGAGDGCADSRVAGYCVCGTSLPPLHLHMPYDESCTSYDSYDSRKSLHSYGSESMNDSAYDSTRSSPAHRPVCYATVTYFNVNDSEDSSSIHTEYTLLDHEPDDESAQNAINEGRELVSTL